MILAAVFFFPMVWMVLSSFKTDRAIFTSPFALPETIDFAVWAEAWEVVEQVLEAQGPAIAEADGGARCVALVLPGTRRDQLIEEAAAPIAELLDRREHGRRGAQTIALEPGPVVAERGHARLDLDPIVAAEGASPAPTHR